MARQKQTTAKQKPKPRKLIDPEPFPNDWLEWVAILTGMIGVGGGIFALLYLAKVNGAI